MSAASFSAEAVDAMIAQAANARGIDLAQAQAVLALRRRHSLDGNRRRLFAALDDLLSGTEIATGQGAEPNRTSDGPIQLRRLVLRNWKVFEQLDLRLPRFAAERPIVLVGGKNGYGKTSLLEGLIIGLFGRAAVLDLTRLEATARNASYRTTLMRAFNQRAFRRGERVMSVSAEWDTPEGPLSVERKWYLDDAGTAILEDESLTLRTGDEGGLIACPLESDPTEFYQEEVHRRLLTPSLAAFIFFDGERVERFAEAAFSDQVRAAVESASGLTLWRRAAVDLRAYAKDRLRGDARPEENAAQQLPTEQLRRDLSATESALAEVLARRRVPEQRRDEILEEIAQFERGNYQNLHQLIERRQANAADTMRARHELATAATAHLPFLMCRGLGAKLAGQLQSEMSLGAADAALFQNEDALEALIAALDDDDAAGGETSTSVRRAWARLRDMRTAVEDQRHPYIPIRLKAALAERLSQAGNAGPVRAAADRLRALELEAEALADAASARKSRDEGLGAARRRLSDVRQDISSLDAEARIFEDRLATLRAGLEAIDGVIAKDCANPAAEGAIGLAETIEDLVTTVLPQCFVAVGEAVTQAYLALAHKGLVARVHVAEDGAVAMLDQDGRDVREFDASAGESHVFAMALIAAVGALTGNRLPTVIDTPMGRLDPDHRLRILRFFASCPRQTVLLSQPNEVNGPYLKVIEDRVSACFRLDHASADGGLGATTAAAGYFKDLAA